MKKSFIIVTLFAFSLGLVFYACSNDNGIEQEDNQLIMKGLDYEFNSLSGTDISKTIVNQFEEYLRGGSCEMLENVTWDFDNMVELSNVSESVYCYMAVDADNPDRIIGGCSTSKGLITTFFSFEKNADYYTLKDEQNLPLVDVSIDENFNKAYFFNFPQATETRASFSEWCGIGMGVVGGVACYALAPPSFGASFGFAACWGVITALVCRV